MEILNIELLCVGEDLRRNSNRLFKITGRKDVGNPYYFFTANFIFDEVQMRVLSDAAVRSLFLIATLASKNTSKSFSVSTDYMRYATNKRTTTQVIQILNELVRYEYVTYTLRRQDKILTDKKRFKKNRADLLEETVDQNSQRETQNQTKNQCKKGWDNAPFLDGGLSPLGEIKPIADVINFNEDDMPF